VGLLANISLRENAHPIIHILNPGKALTSLVDLNSFLIQRLKLATIATMLKLKEVIVAQGSLSQALSFRI